MSIFLLLRDQLHDFMFSMVVMFTPNSWTSIWSNMNMIDIFPIYLANLCKLGAQKWIAFWFLEKESILWNQ
jgi:hypothetical protein